MFPHNSTLLFAASFPLIDLILWFIDHLQSASMWRNTISMKYLQNNQCFYCFHLWKCLESLVHRRSKMMQHDRQISRQPLLIPFNIAPINLNLGMRGADRMRTVSMKIVSVFAFEDLRTSPVKWIIHKLHKRLEFLTGLFSVVLV